MASAWVCEEMKTVQLNDKRLNERLLELTDQLSQHPTASIPAACGGYDEMTAAYRFFDNDKVTFDDVLQPHIDATQVRIASQPVVLLTQDTSEVDLTRPLQQMVGAGPLDHGSRRGLLLHVLHAFTPDGTPLGTVAATPLIRSDDEPTNAGKTRAERQQEPIEEKESYRWVQTLGRAQHVARQHPTVKFITLADSEADIYEYLAEAVAGPENAHWIVRAAQDRAVTKETTIDEESARLIREQAMATPVLYTQTISVRGRDAKVSCEARGRRQPRESRMAEVEVRAVSLTLRPPYRPDRELSPITLNVVLVSETHPPADDVPIEWMLLTDLPIDTLEHVREVVNTYCVRWMIEIYFRTLKSGCRIEDRRFEHIDRFLPCLAIYLTVAWRTLYLCRLGRSTPHISCEAVFEPAEWKSVYRVVHRTTPKKAPALQEMICTVAQLGGYVNRKRPDPPGPQTLWLGLQRMHDITACWKLFGPEVEHQKLV